jgi:hypothetical protein
MDYLLFFVRVVSSLVGHFGLNSRVDLDIKSEDLKDGGRG